MTTQKHNYIPRIEKELEKIARQNDEQDEILVRARSLQPRVGASTVRTLTNQGFPQHFDYEYESCTWEYRKGLVLKPEEFLEELEEKKEDE